MEDEEEDSEIGSDVSLPFHLRMHMKTEFLYGSAEAVVCD
jgi:hypothetical protein